MEGSTRAATDQFAADVLEGLSGTPKSLSSKYFYDDEGSRLFRQIMQLPEYYLTRCEFEIFDQQKKAIHEALRNGDDLDLVELGAGDGSKTALLIDYFLKQPGRLSYSPIDISQEALDSLARRFHEQFPALNIRGLRGDYFHILESLKNDGDRRRILLFLGSNIGNFTRESSVVFFRSIREVMGPRDLILIGFDLQKDPKVIVPAYDDEEGVTARFNLNLLTRINRELGGNFDLSKFSHYANYRPIEGSARSFLISREDQDVHIANLDKTFHFGQWEAVFMEISQKYSLQMIRDIAAESGFTIKADFFDSRRYFCDSLWAPV